MADSYLGEIRIFGGNFAPVRWHFCDGSLLSIDQYDALFALLGTNYGGDGRATFGLPDLRGRVPINQGRGPGLTDRRLGTKAGAELATLSLDQIPVHNHAAMVGNVASSSTPTGNVVGAPTKDTLFLQTGTSTDMAPESVAESGESKPHSNMQPYLAINFIISLYGEYPSRN